MKKPRHSGASTVLSFDVFSRRVQVERRADRWFVYLVGNEGLRRPAEGIFLSPDTSRQDLAKELADLCHEWATEEHSCVVQRE